MLNVGFRSTVLATTQLALVHLVVLLLQLAHLFDFIEVDDEASLKIVKIFDAFAAKNGRVLAAVEVLDALLVLLAHVGCKVTLVSFVVLVHIRVGLEAFLEVHAREERVTRHHLVKNVEVEWQLVN